MRLVVALVGLVGLASAAPAAPTLRLPLVHRPRSSVSPQNTTLCVGGRCVVAARRVVADEDRKFTSLQSRDAHDVPMGGDVATRGEYFVTITIGGTDFTVQLDTGSVLTAVPDVDCKISTNPTHPTCSPNVYNASASSTWRRLSCAFCPNNTCSRECEFKVEYGDGSQILGRTQRDDIAIGGLVAKQAYFGSIIVEATPTGRAFENGVADGIFGLSYMRTQRAFGTPLLDNLISSHGFRNVFGVLVGTPGGESTSTGVLTIGGYDPDAFVGELAFAKLTQKTLYHVHLKAIQVDGTPLSGARYGPTIVDSGTTEIVLASRLREPLLNQLMRQCADPAFDAPPGLCQLNNGSHCFYVSEDDVARYPPMEFVLNGWQQHDSITLRLTGKQYMMDMERSVGYRCFYVGFMDIGVLILGDTFMTGFYTVYDREKGRMGFGSMTEANTITQHRSSLAIFPTLTGQQSLLILLAGGIVVLGVVGWAVGKAMPSHSPQGERQVLVPEREGYGAMSSAVPPAQARGESKKTG